MKKLLACVYVMAATASALSAQTSTPIVVNVGSASIALQYVVDDAGNETLQLQDSVFQDLQQPVPQQSTALQTAPVSTEPVSAAPQKQPASQKPTTSPQALVKPIKPSE